MSNADIFTALLQGMQNGSSRGDSGSVYDQMLYSNKDSFWGNLGPAIAGMAPAVFNPYESAGRNLATTGLTTLAGALLSGFGASQTEKKNEELLTQALALESVGSDAERREMVKANPRLAPLYGQLAAQDEAAEQARLKSEAEMQNWQNKELFKLGLMPEKERIKGMYNPSGTRVSVNLPSNQIDGIAKLPADIQTKAAKRESLAQQAERILEKMEQVPANYMNTKGAQWVSALDEFGIGRDLAALTASAGYAESGAALTENEQKVQQKLTQGDFSVGPDQLKQFLGNYAKSQYNDIKTMYKHGQMRGKPEEYVPYLDEKISKLSKSSNYGQTNKGLITVRTADGQTRQVTPEQAKLLGLQ